jgi:hypothetical protein
MIMTVYGESQCERLTQPGPRGGPWRRHGGSANPDRTARLDNQHTAGITLQGQVGSHQS